MIRQVAACIALIVATPAMAAPADPAAAMAFARAWTDPDTTAELAREGLRMKLERCVKAGFTTEEQLAAGQPRLTLYLTTFLDGLGRVQQKVAGKAAQLLSTADLRQITATLTTPLFRQVRRQALAGMAQTLVPRIPGCGDESKPMDVTELGSKALKRVTPAQVAKLRTFMMSPAGQHFNRALAELMPVLMQAYREEAANAIMVAGGTPEMQDAIRRMPSPITIDQ